MHGYARATLDIDIFIRPDRKNAERTLEALRRHGELPTATFELSYAAPAK